MFSKQPKLDDFNQPKSLRWYEDGERSFNVPLDAHFMREDIGSFIMPISKNFSSQQESFAARFNGSEIEVERLRTLVSEIPQHQDYDECDFICDVVNAVGQSLSHEGFALFERRYKRDTTRFQDCLLYEIYPRRVFRVPGGCIQIPPINARPEMSRRRWVYLSNEDIWRVEMPRQLGGCANYRRTLSAVARIGDGMSAYSDLEDLKLNRLSGFDFNVRQQAVKKYRAALTKTFGYGFRDTDSECMTECYFVYRHITLAWAKAVIRSHIIDEINQLASRLGILARIDVEGLLSPDEIIDVRQKAISGETPLVEALEAIRV
jgi:hypothetical protein